MTRPRSIAIVGGGLMGAGIAQVFAAAGHPVTIFEPSDEVRGSIRTRIAADLRLFKRDERCKRCGSASLHTCLKRSANDPTHEADTGYCARQ
jgi:3-hydroxyacyl-CoA dehydrogenase